MDKDVFFRVVMPLLTVVGTALICISTPLKKANFYSELCISKHPDGTPVFNVMQITLKCDKCDLMNKRRGVTAKRACKHVLSRLPPWKDGEKQEMIELIFEQAGRSGDHDRENRGLITDDGDTAFDQRWVDSFVARELYPKKTVPRFIITTCDPNGGGYSSDTSLVSAYYENNKMVICGLDAHATTRDQRENFVLSHIRALRRNSRFKDCYIVWVPENNMDAASYQLVNALAPMSKVHVYADNTGTEGMRTGRWSKITYTECAKMFMEPEECLYYDQDLVVANPFKPHNERLIETKTSFVRQLRQWRKLVFGGKTAKGDPYITCSGKTDETGKMISGQKDDMSIAFILNAAFSQVMRSPTVRNRLPRDIFG